MSTTELRAVTDTPRQAIGQDLAAVEPSHIHIPRPSRVRQPIIAQRDDDASVPVQLDLALEQAA
jgi:hypothetical protein